MISPSLFHFPSISIFYFGKNNNNKIWILIDELFIGLLPPPPRFCFLWSNRIIFKSANITEFIFITDFIGRRLVLIYLIIERERKMFVLDWIRNSNRIEPVFSLTLFGVWVASPVDGTPTQFRDQAHWKEKKPFDLRFSTESEIFSTPTSI